MLSLMNYFSYNLGPHVLNITDISIPQRNYMRKFSDDALENQQKFFEENNLASSFSKRIMKAGDSKCSIIKIDDESLARYTNNTSNCNGIDALFTAIPELPLVACFGDCPQLFIAGKRHIGIIHAGRQTLDSRIIERFFEQFIRCESTYNCRIGFSPYIHKENFPHTYLDLKRKDWNDMIEYSDGRYYLDLKAMILKDLKRVGIDARHIMDNDIDTFKLSQKSEKAGGYQISHRQATNKEGRGIMLIMLKNQAKQ